MSHITGKEGDRVQDFIKSWRFKVLIALVIVLVAFMIRGATSEEGLAGFTSQLMSTITAPLQKISSSTAHAATEFFSQFVNASSIKEENEELQAQINELNQKLVDYEKIKAENEQYKQFLEIKELNPDYQFETATVIGRDPNERFGSFTIDKGSLHGVSFEDPVITSAGLVGRVYEVGLTSSKVMTILDVSTNVGAYDSQTQDTGIVTGYAGLADQGLCRMIYIDRESSVAVGDLITTSGSGGTYPQGLVIGTVTDIRPDDHSVSLVATIQPAEDILNVKDVVVITSFLGQKSSLSDEEQAEGSSDAEAASGTTAPETTASSETTTPPETTTPAA